MSGPYLLKLTSDLQKENTLGRRRALNSSSTALICSCTEKEVVTAWHMAGIAIVGQRLYVFRNIFDLRGWPAQGDPKPRLTGDLPSCSLVTEMCRALGNVQESNYEGSRSQ